MGAGHHAVRLRASTLLAFVCLELLETQCFTKKGKIIMSFPTLNLPSFSFRYGESFSQELLPTWRRTVTTEVTPADDYTDRLPRDAGRLAGDGDRPPVYRLSCRRMAPRTRKSRRNRYAAA